MKKERTLKAMQEIAESEITPDIDLWPRFERQLAAKQQAPGLLVARLASRLGWAAAVLALLFLMGTVVYATSPAFRALLAMDPGLQDAEVGGQPLDLSQTVNDVTVTLDWAYADANRIAIAYSIDGPGSETDLQRYHATGLTLRHENGAIFTPTIAMGVRGQSDLLGVELPPGQSAIVASFDATSLSGNPEILALQLELAVELFDATASSEEQSAELVEDAASAEVVQLEPLADEHNRIGRLSFHFTVPMDPARRVMNEPMTVTAQGIDVTLERLLVTPSETTAVLCFDPPEGVYVEWLPIATVAVRGTDSRISGTAQGSIQTPLERRNCTMNRFLPSLYEANGSWTLEVTELLGWTADGRNETRIEGPWEFEITFAP